MKILKFLICSGLLLFAGTANSQSSDTLSFFSTHFNHERSIIVKTPSFYKYQSPKVRLPVIFLLDGQHDWFVEPSLNTIKYLQYTHEIPQALVVIIPLINRVKECGLKAITDDLPLDKFITEEVMSQIAKYNPGDFRIIVGHSFSASFALYSHLKNPGFYSGVFAHTPLNEIENLLLAFKENTPLSRIYISAGGIDKSKDFYHRSKFNELKQKHQPIFAAINLYEADHAAHNAVPILANPVFFSRLFTDFRSRFNHIAKVDENYKLITSPGEPKKQVELIREASTLYGTEYPMELPDVNGISSRYSASNFNMHAIAVYEEGLTYYPHYYAFHYSIGELYMQLDKLKAISHLNQAMELLITVDQQDPDKDEIAAEITKLIAQVQSRH